MQLMDTINFQVGDLVRVTTKDLASQKITKVPFVGVVISTRGAAENKTVTVRKNASAHVAVEKTFPLSSPIIDSIKVVKKGDVRRAKLYYLRKSESKN